MGPGVGRSYSIENGEIVVALSVAPDPRLLQVLTAIGTGTAPNLGIAKIAEELDLLIPPEGFSLPIAFTLAQTPEEIAALAGPLAPLPIYLPQIQNPAAPNAYGGIGTQPYGPEPLPTPGLNALFGEDLDVPFALTPMQTPEEMAALMQSVLPAEGSLRRSVTLSVVPDRAQIERSAAEIAESWAAAINARLVGLKQKARAVPDTFEQDLWTEAQSEGVTP
jgi:hypothetical protein